MRLLTIFLTFSMVISLGWLMPYKVHAASAGDLITCPDFSAVYYLAGDGTRWVFPNEGAFFTWFSNFDDVIEVSCADQATYPIGDIVTYQPGTRMVKIQSVTKVYAVEPGGTLRWIQSEADAIWLYGDNWNQRIDDVGVGFWSSYSEGDPLPSQTYPIGTILLDLSTDFYYYVDNPEIRQVGEELLSEVQIAYALELDDVIGLTQGDSVDTTFWNDVKDLAYEAPPEEEPPVEEEPPPEEELVELDVPTLSDPGDVVLRTEIYTVSWSEVVDATGYILEEDTNSNFSSPTEFDLGTVSDKDFSQDVETPTTYYYRVRAKDSEDPQNFSDWSAVRSIKVDPFYLIQGVADANQPPPNTLALGNTSNWCAPMAASNIFDFWDNEVNHQYASSMTAGNPSSIVSDYVGWFMDTNDVGSPDRINGGALGTLNDDIGNGMYDYATWDGAAPSANTYPTPSTQMAGKTGYNGWTFDELDSSGTSDGDAWDDIIDAVRNDEPVLATFDHWNVQDTGFDIEDVDLFSWGIEVANSGMTSLGEVEGTPFELWDPGSIGHAVTVVGFIPNYDAGDGNGTQDWLIVHDNWSSTPEDVAVPWDNWSRVVFADPGPSTTPINPPEWVNPPGGGSIGDFINFEWKTMNDSSLHFEIQWDTESNFPDPSMDTTSVGDSDKMYTNDHDIPDTYYYRVRGINDEGAGPWSETISVLIIGL